MGAKKNKAIAEIKKSYRNTPAWKLLERSNEEKTLCLIHLLESIRKLEEKLMLYEGRMREMEAELVEHRQRLEVRDIVEKLEEKADPDLMTEPSGNC